MTRRLLILMCSDRKVGGADPLPAVERYDGPLWQVLRVCLRAQPQLGVGLDTYVLSAAFGLIPATQAIPWYDQKMTAERAAELQPSALMGFGMLIEKGYDQICLGLSQIYLPALDGWESLVPAGTSATLTDGPIGTKKAQLRAWLEGRGWLPSAPPDRYEADEIPRGEVVVAGVHLQLTRDEVLERARAGLASNSRGADRFRDWFVLIDGQAVSPKWLVSLLCQRPTSAFDASAARRALLALGISVERNHAS